jgi:hypothetical protein
MFHKDSGDGTSGVNGRSGTETVIGPSSESRCCVPSLLRGRVLKTFKVVNLRDGRLHMTLKPAASERPLSAEHSFLSPKEATA